MITGEWLAPKGILAYPACCRPSRGRPLTRRLSPHRTRPRWGARHRAGDATGRWSVLAPDVDVQKPATSSMRRPTTAPITAPPSSARAPQAKRTTKCTAPGAAVLSQPHSSGQRTSTAVQATRHTAARAATTITNRRSPRAGVQSPGSAARRSSLGSSSPPHSGQARPLSATVATTS
jgi:hypothetical protein